MSSTLERITALVNRPYGTEAGYNAGLARITALVKAGNLRPADRARAGDAYRALRQRRDAAIGSDVQRVMRRDVAPTLQEAPAAPEAPVQPAERTHHNEGMMPADAPKGSKLCDGGDFPCVRGRVRMAGRVENGKFIGAEGQCFRCCGKGWQSPADQRRNWGFDRNRVIRL